MEYMITRRYPYDPYYEGLEPYAGLPPSVGGETIRW